MKQWFTLILLAAAINSFAQQSPLTRLVNVQKQQHVPFKAVTAFTISASDKKLAGRGTYQQLQLDPSFSTQLLAERPQAITLPVPIAPGKSFSCELVRFGLGNPKITENDANTIDDIKEPATYRGVVVGDTGKSVVTLTVNNEYLSMVATMSNGTVLQITKADEKTTNTYRLYDSRTIEFPKTTSIDCGTPERANAKASNGVDISGIVLKQQDISPKCVNVFVDCFDSTYKHFDSSRQKTINYVYELFNSVITGYYAAQVNVQIIGINVWTTADPYRGDNRDNALADLAGHYKDNFWGNICVGLDFSTTPAGRSGLAGSIGKVKAVSTNTCPAYVSGSDNPCCYNDLNYNVSVSNFPTGPNSTGQQVYLVMHEMGHLLGAHHTKWCGWKLSSNPDVYGAIDSCGAVEGSCAKGPAVGSGGATIMSYCVTGNTANDFVNYNNGFGTLPGNAILNFIDQTSCLLDCSDCFGLLKLRPAHNDELAFKAPVLNPGGPSTGNGYPKPAAATNQSFINLQKQ